MADVAGVPTRFDSDSLVRSMQPSFDSSDVMIDSIINTVYLIYSVA